MCGDGGCCVAWKKSRSVQKLDPIDIIGAAARFAIGRGAMRTALDPFSFLVTSIAGWMNQHQHHVIDYLMEENRVLREQIGNHDCGSVTPFALAVPNDLISLCAIVFLNITGFSRLIF